MKSEDKRSIRTNLSFQKKITRYTVLLKKFTKNVSFHNLFFILIDKINFLRYTRSRSIDYYAFIVNINPLRWQLVHGP